jgi:hypothetical protein
LEKPEVAAHWNAQIDVLRSAERPHNVFALVDVRDKSGNAMARVQAARTLEGMADEAAARPGGPGKQVMPGLIVHINVPTMPSSRPAIDVTPDRTVPRPLDSSSFGPPLAPFKPVR